MIKTRKEILKINPFFTQFIIDFQQNVYNNLEWNKEGDEILLDFYDNKPTVLTKEKAEELNKELDTEYLPEKNPFDEKIEKKHKIERFFVPTEENADKYLKTISENFEGIRKHLKEDFSIILGVSKTPWLYQENEYPPVKSALEYLKKTINKDFNGGFYLKGKEFQTFIGHLFWLVRCNASLPYFFIGFEKNKSIFSICKYGNIHCNFFDEKEEKEIVEYFTKNGLMEISACNSEDNPYAHNQIEGRELIVD